jgi:hypothetical protein
MKRSRILLTRATLCILFGLTTVCTQAWANDDDRDRRVTIFPPDSRSTSEWTANWWQWVFQIPNSVNPNLDTTGIYCVVGQWGSVFYLSGGGPGPIFRRCTVPAGKTLFFPIINVECSSIEPPPFQGRTDAERRSCVQRWMNGLIPSSLKLTIRSTDSGPPVDINVSHLDEFNVRSPVFTFVLPPDNQFGLPAGTSAFAMSDGIWVVLSLSPGRYTVHFEGKMLPPRAPGTNVQNVTYDLMVLGSN